MGLAGQHLSPWSEAICMLHLQVVAGSIIQWGLRVRMAIATGLVEDVKVKLPPSLACLQLDVANFVTGHNRSIWHS